MRIIFCTSKLIEWSLMLPRYVTSLRVPRRVLAGRVAPQRPSVPGDVLSGAGRAAHNGPSRAVAIAVQTGAANAELGDAVTAVTDAVTGVIRHSRQCAPVIGLPASWRGSAPGRCRAQPADGPAGNRAGLMWGSAANRNPAKEWSRIETTGAGGVELCAYIQH